MMHTKTNFGRFSLLFLISYCSTLLGVELERREFWNVGYVAFLIIISSALLGGYLYEDEN